MPRHITTLKNLGKETSWLLLQQVRGIPEAKSLDDFMEDRTFVLMFSQIDLAERLCVTAAIRQMSGHVVYFAPEEGWTQAIDQFPLALLGAVSYYMDGMFFCGASVAKWANMPTEVTFPSINCGGPDAHPIHVIADLACMFRCCHDDLRGAKVCWLGNSSGTLFSLMTATAYFPFSLSIAMPESAEPSPIMAYAKKLHTDITFSQSPLDGVRNADFVYSGSSRQMDFSMMQKWQITPSIISHASENVHILLGTNPMDSIPMDSSLSASRSSLVLMQAENRLRVYKRILHWVFEI